MDSKFDHMAQGGVFLYPPAAHMQDTDLADIKQQCVSEM